MKCSICGGTIVFAEGEVVTFSIATRALTKEEAHALTNCESIKYIAGLFAVQHAYASDCRDALLRAKRGEG